MTFAEATWGEVDPAVFERIVVVSPHFDDAAMGAGHLLGSYPDTTVITVLAGRPPAYPEVPSEWDALGGFKAGDDVVAARRLEDLAALEVLDVRPPLARVRRPPVPGPGRPAHSATGGARPGATCIAELDPTAVFVPMGLGNPDHVLTHEASLLVRAEQLDREWFCYEDHGYKHIPGLLAWRVAKLLRAHPWPTPAIVPLEPDEDRKRRAIFCYVSQIPPLENEHALTARLESHVPEQFWRLAPPPEGWEGLADFI